MESLPSVSLTSQRSEHQPLAVQPGNGGEFAAVLDLLNPLQHVPVLGSLYRMATGDEIGAPARIMGGFLWGGAFGFLSSAALAVLQERQDLPPPLARDVLVSIGPEGGEHAREA